MSTDSIPEGWTIVYRTSVSRAGTTFLSAHLRDENGWQAKSLHVSVDNPHIKG